MCHPSTEVDKEKGYMCFLEVIKIMRNHSFLVGEKRKRERGGRKERERGEERERGGRETERAAERQRDREIHKQTDRLCVITCPTMKLISFFVL